MTEIATTADPKKAQAWFKKAADTLATKNYDYAITAYVSGLQYDPDNIEQVRKLLQLARVRKAAGGKSGSGMFGESYSLKGSTPVIKMLNALESMAKDPENLSKWETLVKSSTESGAPTVAEFFGDEFHKLVQADKSAGNSTKLGRLRLLKDHFKQLGVFNKARLMLEIALPLAPNDLDLTTEVKNLAAMHVTQQGNYESVNEGGTFKDSVKDFDKQMDKTRMAADVQSDDLIDRQIKEAKAKWEKEPTSPGLLRAYVNMLQRKANDERDNESIKVLEEAFAKSRDYSFRVDAGNIRIKQMGRKLDELKKQVAAATDPERKATLQTRYDMAAKAKLDFEIKEFRERSEKYPTDKEIRYEVGRRYLQAENYDEAIDNLQQAESMPKIRVKVLDLLGCAFMKKGWHEEAVDSFKRAVANFEGLESDETSLSLHYNLGDALEALGNFEDALKEFSFVARLKMMYKDVRDRVQKLRTQIKGGK